MEASSHPRIERDLFDKARNHDRREQLEFAQKADMLPYFRLLTSQAGPVVEMEGRETIMLGSNNYLGLTGDARVKQAAADALETYGTALTGSRLLNGTIPLHVELETELAEWMGTEAALVFTTGYQANVGCIGTILEPGDTVICDSGDHASILDGCKLSGAKLRPYRHNRIDKLEKMLERSTEDGGGVLVVVDGVFSMEGDIVNLPPVVELCKRYGARLMVDEAHGAGAIGPRGAGASELFGLESEVDLRMGTFSKSFASCGGFIAGPAEVIEYLRIAARAFLFSAAAVPAAVGAALQSLRILRSDDGPGAPCETRRQRCLSAQRSDRDRPASRRADGDAGRQRGADPRRAGDRRRRHARGCPLEGALRRRRLHERRDSPGSAAERRPAADEPDGDARAFAARPRPGDLRAGHRRLRRAAAGLRTPVGGLTRPRPRHFA